MPSNYDQRRQPGEPQYPVDLADLQARAEADEPVNVMQAFRDAIPDEQVAEMTTARYSSEYSRTQGLSEARDSVRRRIAARLFVDTFNTAIAASDNIQTFSWRTSVMVQATYRGLTYYRDYRHGSNDMKGEPVKYQFEEFANTLSRQLLKFCEDKPEVSGEALETWLASMLEAIKGPKRNQANRRMACISTPLQRAALERNLERKKRNKVSLAQAAQDEAIVREVHSRLAWFDTPVTPRSNDINTIASDLEMIPIGNNNSKNLEFLLDRFDQEAVNLGRPGQLIRPSVNTTINIVESLTNLIGDDKPSHARYVRDCLREVERNDDGTVAYTSLTRLVNTKLNPLIKAIRTEEDFNLAQLNESALEDFPRAIDRIVYFIMADQPPQQAIANATNLKSTVADSFRLAIDCAKVFALQGTNQKLAELDKYDLELMTAGLSPDDVAYIMEGTDPSTVHGLHRHMRHVRAKKGYVWIKGPGRPLS